MELPSKEISKMSYPLRPRAIENSRFTPVPLVSNHYWVKFDSSHKIFIYSVDFEPKIGADVRTVKQRILASPDVVKTLTAEIGFYVLTGATVFGAKVPSFEESITFPTVFSDKSYTLKITLKRSFSISDIYSEDRKSTAPAFKFFNILIKHVLRSMKLLEFGRSSKYFNLEKSVSIPDTNLRIFHGYLTSFNHYECGFFLKIDVSHKIIRTETVLNYVDEIYSRNQGLSKDEKRKRVKEALMTRTVLAMYGNYRYWRIDDIIFDQDCDSFEFDDEREAFPQNKPNVQLTQTEQPHRKFTITQYYKDRYNMKVTKPRQPLIVHNQLRTGKVFYILPEFCVMTGIPEDITDITRKKVTDLCIKKPHQRMSEVQSLVETMLAPPQQDGGNNPPQATHSLGALRELGIEFQGDPVFFEGKLIPAPKLLVGNQQVVEQRSGTFQMKQEVFEAGDEISWAILCSREFKCDRLLEQFHSWAKALGVRLSEARIFDYGKRDEGKKAIIEIENILEHKVPGFYDIVIIVLPNSMKSYYKPIKQKCYLTLGILSQVVLQGTLEKKGFYQICSKVLQQILSKVGSKLWVAQPPKGLSEHTMLIGIDTSPDKQDKNRSVFAFCASMDKTFSRYYSRVVYQKKSEETILSMKQLIKDSIVAYQKINGEYPQHLIYLRDGVLESVERDMQSKEVKDIMQAFAEQSTDKIMVPKVTIIAIDKRITQKFFSVDGKRQLENPAPGTLIDNTIASKYYDFYLIAQNVTRGTATPTHYKVIFDNSEMPAEILQELVYSQCFAYMNWSGAIRIPAPCQYAHKLCSFVSQHINEEPVKLLRSHFYYL